MTAPLFVISPQLTKAVGVGERVSLAGPEGHHAVAVRRMRVGERIDLTDAHGALLRCRVAAISGRDELWAEVLAVFFQSRPAPWLTVVQALPKGEAGELAVTLLTEVGVDEIVPWSASRSVARWDATKAQRGAAKWQAAAHAAGKQARRPRFPVIAPLADTAAVQARIATCQVAAVLHEEAAPGAAGPVEEWLGFAGAVLPSAVLLIVGPEGGIADDELAAFRQAGARCLWLGPTVMRAATAGAFAAAALLSRTPRWRHAGDGRPDQPAEPLATGRMQP